MRILRVVAAALMCVSLHAQRAPQLTVSPLQVANGDHVTVRGTGFSANRAVISHLRRPDHSESYILRFLTNDLGEFSHTIDTLMLDEGTHELWVVDENSQATSNTVRFGVAFNPERPAPPEATEAVRPFVGVWRGTGARSDAPAEFRILLTIVGSPGSSAGIVVYPDLGCGAVLAFRAIYRDTIELTDASRYGLDACPANGITTVKLSEDGSLALQWRHPTLRHTISAKLNVLR